MKRINLAESLYRALGGTAENMAVLIQLGFEPDRSVPRNIVKARRARNKAAAASRRRNRT